MLVLGNVTLDVDGNPTVSIFSRKPLTGELKYYATNEVGPRWYVDLLNVTFNPSGNFSPIGDTFAKLSVTGTVQAIDGVFGTMVLKPDVSSVIPENVLAPTISGTPKVGEVLTANIGGWIGASSYAYLWKVAGTTPAGTPVNQKNLHASSCRCDQNGYCYSHCHQRDRTINWRYQRAIRHHRTLNFLNPGGRTPMTSLLDIGPLDRRGGDSRASR